jgi:hypothetical protein
LPGSFRDGFLLLVVIKDGRAILGAHIRPLPVQGSWVVGAPEHVQQVLKGNDLRIICDLHRFGVTGVAGTHLLIGGILHAAARVAGHDLMHAFQVLENGFHTPKTAGRQRCFFKFIRHHNPPIFLNKHPYEI